LELAAAGLAVRDEEDRREMYSCNQTSAVAISSLGNRP